MVTMEILRGLADCLVAGLLFLVFLASLAEPARSLQTGSTPSPPDCARVIQMENGSSLCLWLATDLLGWQEADEQCAQHGGYLLAATSPEINEAAVNIMHQQSVVNIWLGLRENSTTWHWLSDDREVFYQGCYVDDPSDPDLEERYFLSSNNSYSSCASQCSSVNKRYAGLQAERECWCGDTFGRHGYTMDCNLLCANRAEVCGGDEANTVVVPGGAYYDWDSGQPNNHLSYQSCAVMDEDSRWQWNDLTCTEVSGVICELDWSMTDCLQRGFQYNSTWGCFVVTDHVMTFYEGLQFCADAKGKLLTLQNREKRDFYADFLHSINDTERGYFIGLVRTKWYWSTGENFVYSKWDREQPNGREQRCATLGIEGKWSDVKCNEPYAFICQKGEEPRVPTTTPPPTTPSTTPTTTPEPTPFICDAYCQHQRQQRVDQIERERNIVIYSLIGGGALLLIILISCTIGTVFVLKRHFKKKKENRFDYFFGVDVSKPEDATEFRSSKKPGPEKEKEPPSKNTIETAVIVEAVATELEQETPGKRASLPPDVVMNAGVDNEAFRPPSDSDPVPPGKEVASDHVDQTSPEESHEKGDPPVTSTPDITDNSVSPTAEDRADLVHAPANGQAGIENTSVNMSSYDYEMPHPSQMIY